ncbi:MAG: GNAT family N-acetyltransferase [Bacteroidetes bacterium]|nr:GNAT family N-acetyltransferase [Bacteroidota bacterium]
MIVSKEFIVSVSNEKHIHFAREIELLIEQATNEKSVGLNLKKGHYIDERLIKGDAIIATKQGRLAGFCYLRKREDKNLLSISGIVVAPQFRKLGLAKAIIREAFELVRKKYPNAKLFSLTNSPEIMNVNSHHGYKPINYNKLSTSESFWEECSECPNYNFLKRNNNNRCLCTAMLFNPFSFNIEDELELNDQAVQKNAKVS